MTSKLAGQNLTPFFEKWGLTPKDDTRDKIEKLNLPKLEKEIWLSTDSNPIRENKLDYMRFHTVSRMIQKSKM